MTNDDPQLSFATTEQLRNELCSRYPHALIMLEQFDKNDKHILRPVMSWQGGPTVGLGLAAQADRMLRRILDESDEQKEQDEE